MPTYSNEFKKKMVALMSGPNARSATALGREMGVPQASLSRWRQRAATLGVMDHHDATAPQTAPNGPSATRSAEDKLRILTAAQGLQEDALGVDEDARDAPLCIPEA